MGLKRKEESTKEVINRQQKNSHDYVSRSCDPISQSSWTYVKSYHRIEAPVEITKESSPMRIIFLAPSKCLSVEWNFSAVETFVFDQCDYLYFMSKHMLKAHSTLEDLIVLNMICPEDVKETVKLLAEIPELSSNVSDTIQGVIGRIKKGELQTSEGLSFLDLKNHTMLNYLMNLTYIITRKLSGKKIENDPAIDRLVELRTVLEKMRPIEEKLKYQINKLQSAVRNGNIDGSDPLNFRANPDNLNDQEDEEQQEEKKESNVYIPPKISAAYFDEESAIEKPSKKRAFRNTELYELQRELSDKPEEYKETADPDRKNINEENQRKRYEEEYFTRLPKTKKQKGHFSKKSGRGKGKKKR